MQTNAKVEISIIRCSRLVETGGKAIHICYLNPHNFLPVRNDIICRGVKRYQWDILPITVRHLMTDTVWWFNIYYLFLPNNYI